MNENYWDDISKNYTDEIFSVLEHDKKGYIKKFLKDKKAQEKRLIDFGCGIGHVIPLLSKQVKFVDAVDISQKCLNIARKKYGDLENVSFIKADMANASTKLKKADLAVAINSIIGSSLGKRVTMLKAIRRSLKKDGSFLLVVPSLESFYYSAYRLNEWELREGEKINPPAGFMFGDIRKVSLPKITQGMIPICGVLTKHYLKEELISLMNYVGFAVEKVKKMEYPWKTEFHQPPRWMKEPFPWDWCCIAKKV